MRSRQNVFGEPAADRRGIERSDDAWTIARRNDASARFILLNESRCLVDEHPASVKFSAADLPPALLENQLVFLGMMQDAPLFALNVDTEQVETVSQRGHFMELRAVATELEPGDAACVVHARAVLHWHAMNRFCGVCGNQLTSTAAGHSRRCLDPACAVNEFFPRIDPAVIVLVTHDDHCLLGRQAAWPERRYSCLAGFMEAGETLEETVRREALEEAGVTLEDIIYHSSQPWPFPQSLMVGFLARATSREIILHDDELEDARWFTREQLRVEVEQGTLLLSSRLSIAWRLVRDWYAEEADADELDALTGHR